MIAALILGAALAATSTRRRRRSRTRCPRRSSSSAGGTTVTILHPERGAVGFSATGDHDALVSKIRRGDYEEWFIWSGDPYPRLALRATFPELIAWEERRSTFKTPGCSISLSTSAPKRANCRSKSPDIERWWEARSRPIFENPPEAWYELVKQLRRLSPRYGQKDPRLESQPTR